MTDTPDQSLADLVARAAELGPWWFAFDYRGQRLGGKTPRDTEKVEVFFDWARRFGSVETILELGSHEGSHSLQMGSAPGVRRVLGLEGREDNLRRAQFVRDVFRPGNVEFRHCNLEQFNPAEYGQFDAVFCSGLLYHLPEPWRLIEKIAPVCRFLFLDTHYAPVEDASAGGFAGQWQLEGTDGLSGLSSRSFWLSFRHLVMLLMENGFVIRYVRDGEEPPGPRAWLFAEKADARAVGCQRSSKELDGPIQPPSASSRLPAAWRRAARFARRILRG